mmetsp:Transcript_6426/g.14340  ORF Transcript_6426/g.14340 Transcript_6426/m.14340 type:complete len:99 (-) Transcript_6426:525-821(-)
MPVERGSRDPTSHVVFDARGSMSIAVDFHAPTVAIRRKIHKVAVAALHSEGDRHPLPTPIPTLQYPRFPNHFAPGLEKKAGNCGDKLATIWEVRQPDI